MSRIILILFAWISMCVMVQAQTVNCTDRINEAEKLMRKGQFKQVVETLEPCVPSLSKSDKFEACRLLSQAHMALLNNERSDYYLRMMLRLNPDYQKYPGLDPAEFTKEMRKFRTMPNLLAGIMAGAGFTNSVLSKSYSVYNSRQSYLPMPEYHVGGMVEYFFHDRISLQLTGMFNRQQINHLVEDAGGWKQEMTETQNYVLLLPSLNAYAKLTGKITGFANAGYGLNRMYDAAVFLTSKNLSGEDLVLASKNSLSERIVNQPVLSGKVGLQMPVGKGMASFEFQYLYFLKNTADPAKRMEDINFIFNNQYVHDDVALRSNLFTFGYKIPVVYRVRANK